MFRVKSNANMQTCKAQLHPKDMLANYIMPICSRFLLQRTLLIGMLHEEKERAQTQHDQYVNMEWGLQQGRFIDTQI